jgi:hypothetical protein
LVAVRLPVFADILKQFKPRQTQEIVWNRPLTISFSGVPVKL